MTKIYYNTKVSRIWDIEDTELEIQNNYEVLLQKNAVIRASELWGERILDLGLEDNGDTSGQESQKMAERLRVLRFKKGSRE